jgi:hypothetical protein
MVPPVTYVRHRTDQIRAERQLSSAWSHRFAFPFCTPEMVLPGSPPFRAFFSGDRLREQASAGVLCALAPRHPAVLAARYTLYNLACGDNRRRPVCIRV